MTKILNTPLAQGNPPPPMKIVIQESRPYQGGQAWFSPGRYEATWNGSDWMVDGTTVLEVIMPRLGSDDPVYRGEVKVFITAHWDNPDKSRTTVLSYQGAEWGETSAGVFDLAVNPRPVAWVASSTLTDLISGTTAARDSAQAAAANVNAATTSLTAERAAVQTALTNISAVGAVQHAAPTRAALDPLLSEGERGLSLENGEIVWRVGANISRLGFATTDHIPLRGLSSADALGDLQQRIADAGAYTKPLDGAGGLIEVALGGTTLALGAATLRNVELRVDVAAGGTALSLTGTRQQIAAGWSGTRGTAILTIPGHGCAVGDLIYVEGTENWNPARVYYVTGQVCHVLSVPDANTVKVSEPLKFDYAGAALYRQARQDGRGRLVNVALICSGGANAYGAKIQYGQGRMVDNLRLEGFRTTGLTVQSSVGTLAGYESHDTFYAGSGTSYGLMVTELSDLDLIAPRISGGRHALAHGGNRPAVTRIHGGRLDGGADQMAFDAHGGVWSVSLTGVRIAGGATAGAYLNRFTDCEISQAHPVNAALYALNEAPAGASVIVRGGSIRKHASAGNIASVRVTRSVTSQTGGALADVVYGRVELDTRIVHEVGAPGNTGSSDQALMIESTMELFRLRGSLRRVPQAGQAGQASSIRLDRVRVTDIDVDNEGEPVSANYQGAAGSLQALPERIRIAGNVRNVGDAATLHPAYTVMGDTTLGALPSVDADLTSDNLAASALYVGYAARVRARLNSTRSGRYAASPAQQTALSLLEVAEAHVLPGTRCDEQDPNARHGVYATGNTNLWFDGPAYLRAPVAPAAATGGSTIVDRAQVREAVGGAAYPTLKGTAVSGAGSLAAGARINVEIPVSGAMQGDYVQLMVPRLLEAGLSVEQVYVNISASPANNYVGTVRVWVANRTAAAINYAALTWGARVLRA